MNAKLPQELLDDRVGIPSPFRRLDMTHHDVIALGERYVDRFPDRAQAILLVGLRTSGSYFAPLLRAFLANKGYASVSLLTLSPSKGPGRDEAKELRRYAEQGYTAVIVDDPPHTGGTILTAIEIARRAGFAPGKLRALVPPHPARPHWFRPLSEDIVISLDPEQWQKRRLLDLKTVQQRLSEYFGGRDYTRVSVIASDRAEAMNAHVAGCRLGRTRHAAQAHLRSSSGDAAGPKRSPLCAGEKRRLGLARLSRLSRGHPARRLRATGSRAARRHPLHGMGSRFRARARPPCAHRCRRGLYRRARAASQSRA